MAAIRQSKRQKSLLIRDIGVKTEIDRILFELRSTKLTKNSHLTANDNGGAATGKISL